MPLITAWEQCAVRRKKNTESCSGSSWSELSGSSAQKEITASWIEGRSAMRHPLKDGHGKDSLYEPTKDTVSRSSFKSWPSTPPTGEEPENSVLYSMHNEEHSPPPLPSVSAATPQEFAEYFPSTRRLTIKHDDMTDDGNMNMRVDLAASTLNRLKTDLTLFHLRMHDLRGREFSFRRYCRDSGKEICHSKRKQPKAFITRPGLRRSMSSALSSLRSKSDTKTATVQQLKRQDPGYDSTSDDEDETNQVAPCHSNSEVFRKPSNSIELEFSNYAHLEINRKGTRSSKRYQFEYWGTKYAWCRTVSRSGSIAISYHLIDTASPRQSIAHIVPMPLSVSESREEKAKGGWVTPCSMWINDEKIVEKPFDVADIIVASGLIALVDECIRCRWN